MTGRSPGSAVKRSRQRAATEVATALTSDLMSWCRGHCNHPDELPRRVMTTHPAVVDADTRWRAEGLWRQGNTAPAVIAG